VKRKSIAVTVALGMLIMLSALGTRALGARSTSLFTPASYAAAYDVAAPGDPSGAQSGVLRNQAGAQTDAGCW